jgi:DNA-binding transcriptional LysR family regulator
MDTLNGIVCFIRSAESGSFAAAGRALGLTPAAVGKNVARLEASLGVRLFQRSTRRLSLTEAGEAFRLEVVDSLDSLQTAMSNATVAHASPVGRLRVSMGNAFGRDWIVPMLGAFLRANPKVQPDWHFDNRAVDLIGEGFDVAIGGGFELQPGLVARPLAPAHRVLVASPAYLATRGAPGTPAELAGRAGILLRSPQTGRIRNWMLTDGAGGKASIDLETRILFDDPDAATHAAMQGLGIALVSVPHALLYIERGVLRRVLPDWWVDAGDISIYYAAQKLLPRKTRVFVEHVMGTFERDELAARFSARHPAVR